MRDEGRQLRDAAKWESLLTGFGAGDSALAEFLDAVVALGSQSGPPPRPDLDLLLTGRRLRNQRRRHTMRLAAAATVIGVAVGLGGAAAASETVRAPLHMVLHYVIEAIGFRSSLDDGHQFGDDTSTGGLPRPSANAGSGQRPLPQPSNRLLITRPQRALALFVPTASDPGDRPGHDVSHRGDAAKTVSQSGSGAANPTLRSTRSRSDAKDSIGSQAQGSRDQGSEAKGQESGSQDRGDGYRGQDDGAGHRGDGSKGGQDQGGDSFGGDQDGSAGQGET